MKKYGQADIICAVIHIFLEQQKELTEDQKKKIEEKCCDDIKDKYPTAAEWGLINKLSPLKKFSVISKKA